MEPVVNVEVRRPDAFSDGGVAFAWRLRTNGATARSAVARPQLISEERKKLVCSLCHICEGACVQCCVNTWSVAGPVLCSAGPRG